jgi:hypothetical protein
MLATTLAQEFRISNPNFYDNESRIEQAGAYELFQRQTASSNAVINDALRQAFAASNGRATKVAALNAKNVVVRETRPLIIPDDENTSAFYTVTPVTYAAGFSMYAAQHANNDVKEQEDFNWKYRNVIEALVASVEEDAVAALEDSKTQVATAIGQNVAFASDVITETLPNGSNQKDSQLLHFLEPIMNQNKHYSGARRMSIVGNYGLQGLLNQQASYSGFNSEDKTIQWAGKEFMFSNQIDNASGHFATGYAVAPDAIGMVSRVEIDAILGTNLGTSHKWDTVMLPGLNIPVAVYEYDNAVDINALHAGTGHLTRTGRKAIDFAVDIAFVTHYVSDRSTIPSKIYKFDTEIADA